MTYWRLQRPRTRGMEILCPLLILVLVAMTGCESRSDGGATPHQRNELALVPMAPGCNPTSQHLVALSGPEVDLPIVGLDWGERFLIVPRSAPYRISLFDGDGSFIRHVGRRGQGPGEFGVIAALLPFADSLLAMDARNHRGTVFDNRLEYVREFPLPLQVDGSRPSLSPDHHVLVSGQMADRRHSGSPVVKLNWEGEAVRYFGEAARAEENPAGRVLPRALTVISDTLLATLPPTRYSVELWTMDGGRLSTIDREVPWFDWPPDLVDSEPENRLVDVQADERGRIWTLALIDGMRWREGVEDGRVVDHAAWVDAAIDIMDVGSGESVCTYRLPDRRVPGGFVGTQTILTYEEDTGGDPTVRFWRLEADVP